jgi:hypothetical protein
MDAPILQGIQTPGRDSVFNRNPGHIFDEQSTFISVFKRNTGHSFND